MRVLTRGLGSSSTPLPGAERQRSGTSAFQQVGCCFQDLAISLCFSFLNAAVPQAALPASPQGTLQALKAALGRQLGSASFAVASLRCLHRHMASPFSVDAAGAQRGLESTESPARS